MSLWMMSLIIGYVVGSLALGFADILEMRKQADYMMSVPVGDIGEFVSPKAILGIHNIIFLPSLILIGLWIGFCWVVNLFY